MELIHPEQELLGMLGGEEADVLERQRRGWSGLVQKN
jgi:hypothetical protein